MICKYFIWVIELRYNFTLYRYCKTNFKNMFEIYSPKVEVVNHSSILKWSDLNCNSVLKWGDYVQCECWKANDDTTMSSDEVRKTSNSYIFHFQKIHFQSQDLLLCSRENFLQEIFATAASWNVLHHTFPVGCLKERRNGLITKGFWICFLYLYFSI